MTFQTTYKRTRAIVNKRIADGSLPKSYKLPPLSSFPTPPNEALKKIPSPDYVFVPMGLTFSQWDTLLQKTCNGLWHSGIWEDDLFKGSGWELWVVPGVAGPTEVNISKKVLDERGTKLPSAQ